MEYVVLINALLPLISNMEPIVSNIIKHIRKEQPGMSDDEILNHASSVLDEEGVAMLKEQLRLQAEIDAQGGA